MHQEYDLGVRWASRGASAIQAKRNEFQPEMEQQDPMTRETVKVFPAPKRFLRQMLQIPFALVASIALGTLIATCFGIEIFISEIYNGPLKGVLVSMEQFNKGFSLLDHRSFFPPASS